MSHVNQLSWQIREYKSVMRKVKQRMNTTPPAKKASLYSLMRNTKKKLREAEVELKETKLTNLLTGEDL